MKSLYNKTTALKVVIYEMWAMNKNIIISIPIIVFAIFAAESFWSGSPFNEQFVKGTDPGSDSFYHNLWNATSQWKVFLLFALPVFLMWTLPGYLTHIKDSFNTLTYPIKPFERVLGICLFAIFIYLLTIGSIVLFDYLLVSLYRYLYLDGTIAYLERQGQFYEKFGEHSIFNTVNKSQLIMFSSAILLSIPYYLICVYMFKKYATLILVVFGVGATILFQTFNGAKYVGNMQLLQNDTVAILWRYIYGLFLVFMVLLSFYYKLKEKEH